jgi:hypothetical protein
VIYVKDKGPAGFENRAPSALPDETHVSKGPRLRDEVLVYRKHVNDCLNVTSLLLELSELPQCTSSWAV